MQYLAKYNLTEEDIHEIKNMISDDDYLEYTTSQDNITKILDFFVAKGLKNIKDFLEYRPEIFYNHYQDVIDKINSREDAITLLNEDILNYDIL